MDWRGIARQTVSRVLSECGACPEPALKKALRAAYPFGVRCYHPYRIWCDEVKKQMSGWRLLQERGTNDDGPGGKDRGRETNDETAPL